MLGRIFARIHDDEVRHLDFHAATLPRFLDDWPRPMWWLARVIWTTAVLGTGVVVAWDHRRVLRACDSGPLRFLAGVIGLWRRHEPRFFGQPGQPLQT